MDFKKISKTITPDQVYFCISDFGAEEYGREQSVILCLKKAWDKWDSLDFDSDGGDYLTNEHWNILDELSSKGMLPESVWFNRQDIDCFHCFIKKGASKEVIISKMLKLGFVENKDMKDEDF